MPANETFLKKIGRARWTHGACVLGGIGFATLIRFPIQPIIHNTSPFLFYLPVVLIVAIALGPRLGLIATAASIVPANYFWMAPERSFAIDFNELCQILGFSLVGCSVSWLSETARKRKQLEEHLRATLASMGEAVITTDCRGKIVYLNVMAQVLTELHAQEPIGCLLTSALDLVAEDGQALTGTFQEAVKNDAMEGLPRRVVISSKTGRRCMVEPKLSRILDPSGQRLGTVILFHRSESSADLKPVPNSRATEDCPKAKSELPRIARSKRAGIRTDQP